MKYLKEIQLSEKLRFVLEFTKSFSPILEGKYIFVRQLLRKYSLAAQPLII